MKASVTVVIVKCELTYIQLAASISQSVPLGPGVDRRLDEQAERALEADQLARVVERLGGPAVGQPAHEPVEPVGAAEEQDLAQQVAPALGEEARGEAVGSVRMGAEATGYGRAQGADRTAARPPRAAARSRRSAPRAEKRARTRSRPARRTSTSVQPGGVLHHAAVALRDRPVGRPVLAHEHRAGPRDARGRSRRRPPRSAGAAPDDRRLGVAHLPDAPVGRA